MTITKPVTQLDFDALKAEMITFIKTNEAFSDYNFEGSALNAIADLLAFNLHSNAFYGNMVHNESFMDTLQKRSSGVSKAKEMGYCPRSAVASAAFLNVTATGVGLNNQSTIGRGTGFTSGNDNGAYTFYATENTNSVVQGVNHVFNNLRVVAGIPASNYFTVDTMSNIRSMFTIPNSLIDTSTLKVFVRSSLASIDREEYFLSKNVFELDDSSRVYFLQESYDGSFQIYFGDNIIGKQPTNGNVIDVDYFVASNIDLSDGCRVFGFEGTIGTATNIAIETSQVSFGGADKESLDSIKFNAFSNNTTKGRAVSTSDYAMRIKEDFNFVKSVSVWGGEDNVPPMYGKVFVSIQPVSGYTISDEVKRDLITPVIRKASMMTIGVEYTDPTYLDMYFITKVKYAQNQTLSTKSEIEALVKAAIVDYINSISNFNKEYLESALVTKISSIDPGIKSVNMEKRLGFKLTPLLGIETSHIKTIFNAIKPNSITSSSFNTVWGGVVYTVSIRETGSYTSERFAKLGMYTPDGELIREVGYVDLETGSFNLTINVNSYVTESRHVSLQFSVVSDDVSTSRNQILKMAKTIESSSGLNYNVVFAETYVK